jgi:hypothetical protein
MYNIRVAPKKVIYNQTKKEERNKETNKQTNKHTYFQ